MFTGDSLNVVLWLAGAALATMIGALTAPRGWRTGLLWGLCCAFALGLLAWIVAPAASPIMQVISPVAVALVESNALAMVGIVGVVALMQSRRRDERGGEASETKAPTVKASPRPAFTAPGGSHSKWTPDITMLQAADYLYQQSLWGSQTRYLDKTKVKEELVRALDSGRLTAWAKAHPADDEAFQVKKTCWRAADAKIENGSAFFRGHAVTGYEIQLSRGELETAYPPKPIVNP